MTEATLKRLAEFIDENGGPERDELAAGLLKLQAAVVGQALLTRALTTSLRTRRVNEAGLNRILDNRSLSASLMNLGVAKTNPFTVAECETACKALADQLAQQTDFKNILGTVVGIVKVFV